MLNKQRSTEDDGVLCFPPPNRTSRTWRSRRRLPSASGLRSH